MRDFCVSHLICLFFFFSYLQYAPIQFGVVFERLRKSLASLGFFWRGGELRLFFSNKKGHLRRMSYETQCKWWDKFCYWEVATSIICVRYSSMSEANGASIESNPHVNTQKMLTPNWFKILNSSHFDKKNNLWPLQMESRKFTSRPVASDPELTQMMVLEPVQIKFFVLVCYIRGFRLDCFPYL